MSNRKKIIEYLNQNNISYSKIIYDLRSGWKMVDEQGNECRTQPFGVYDIIDENKFYLDFRFYVFKNKLKVYKGYKLIATLLA